MPDHSDTHIGAQVRELRKRRGMTQRELARAAAVSVSLVSKLEQGALTDTRLETARKLAVALEVPTTVLLTRDADTPDPDTGDEWAAMRSALNDPPHAGELDEPPTVAGVKDALLGAQRLRAGDRLGELAAVLPLLLRDSAALDGGSATQPVRMRVHRLTGWLLTQIRQYEAAATALDRALSESGNKLEAAAVVNVQCWLLLRQGMLEEARTTAVHWADKLEPRISRATPQELAEWGSMLLRVSAASVRDNRNSEANEALRLAGAAATVLARQHEIEPYRLRTFGPVTVAHKRAEIAAVTDQPDQVLKLARQVPTRIGATAASGRNRHLLDVAHAHARLRNRTEAAGILSDILATAPEWLSNQRYARDILGRVVKGRRRLTPEMRTLAEAVRLPL